MTFHLDNPKRESNTDIRGRDKRTGLCGLDSLPRVTDDEAVELMAHHLVLAAIYYKNTPDNLADVWIEVKRIISRDQPEGYQSDTLAGAKAFLDAVNAYHEQLKREQGD